jgi:phage FluMu protein Com
MIRQMISEKIMDSNNDSDAIRKSALAEYETGIRLLRKQKPREAISHIKKALEINPRFKKAQEALEDASEALTWNARYFCRKCGKLVLPNSQYPYLTIDSYCPRCGEYVPTIKEEIISAAEIILKLALFGIFPLLVFWFCGMPNFQVFPERGIVASDWNDLTDGVFMAAAFTPFMLIIMLLLNNPYLLTILNAFMFRPFQGFSYYIAAVFFLFFVIYLYFFFILTPFFAMHKKGLWRNKMHQKQVLIFTAIFVGFIVIIRMASGVFR